MKNSVENRTKVESLGGEWIVRVHFNDGNTIPMQLGGCYKTKKGAEQKRQQHIDNYYK